MSWPLWGGLIALADQYAHHDLGFVNPVICRIARGSSYSQAFHDVTPPGVPAPGGRHHPAFLIGDLLPQLRGCLEHRCDVLYCIELPGGYVHDQVVGLVVGERQAAAVEAVERDDGG